MNMNKWKLFFYFILICFALVIALMISCFDGNDDNKNDDAPSSDSGVSDDDENADGEIWEDSITGLMWQNDTACYYEWGEAKNYCKNLSWGGYNDWRLPSISELRSLIRGCEVTETGGACGVTDDCTNFEKCHNNLCYGWQFDEGEPGPDGYYWPGELKGDGDDFWSSSKAEGYITDIYKDGWIINFNSASIFNEDTDSDNDVRCVR